MIKIWILYVFFILASCQSVKFIKNQDLVSPEFLKNIREAKVFLNENKNEEAWSKLSEFGAWNLNETEQALVNNMQGSILQRQGRGGEAQTYFQNALKTSPRGSEIESQVKLNLSKLIYSRGEYRSSWQILSTLSRGILYPQERKKHDLFRYELAKKLNLNKEGVKSLINYFDSFKSYEEVVGDEFSQRVLLEFASLSKENKEELISAFKEKNFIEPFLIKKYLNDYIHGMDENEKLHLLDKIKRYELDGSTSRTFQDYRNFEFLSGKLDSASIGVALPLSGEMAKFGRKVLEGIDLALFDLYGADKPKVYIRDTHDNGVMARLAIKSLIEDHNVSYIIGGMLSHTANEEYLEAKKYSTLFFSISPIYLSFTEKNSLLFEVFGSIESQVGKFLSPENLEKNGRDFIMLYPNTEAGHYYYNEVLRQAPLAGANLVDSLSFVSKSGNYQEAVKKILQVGYIKTIEENEAVYTPIKIDDEDKNKRLELPYNTVYIPSNFNDALQLIPSFRYFEARGLRYYGGPAWRSQTFLSRHRGFEKIFFISSEESILARRFERIYQDRFKIKPGLIEQMAYEAISLGQRIFTQKFTDRSALFNHLNELTFLEGSSSSWIKSKGIWLKKMSTYKVDGKKYIKKN